MTALLIYSFSSSYPVLHQLMFDQGSGLLFFFEQDLIDINFQGRFVCRYIRISQEDNRKRADRVSKADTRRRGDCRRGLIFSKLQDGIALDAF